ncbi:ABC transporter ATP-binding protein [Paenibacillus tritici]|uniref:ABC transporter ATP-binding protein n=1 Tax=Paenibacillus tritici TaxID=1873425 RepID=UPI001BAB7804|nr:ABC transporter ATP-binding protein [Paenibacillus tritici]QUL56261.1 ABC transporter ATP-binding protein [Paenibacillus tritici]
MKKKDMIKYLFKVMSNYKKMYLMGVAFMVISSITAICMPYFIMMIMDEAVGERDLKLLIYFVVFALFVDIIQEVSTFFSDYFFTKTGRLFVKNLRIECIKHIQRQEGKDLVDQDSGETFTTLFSDIENVQQITTTELVKLVSDIIISVGMLIFLIFLQWDLLLIIIMVQLIIIFLQKIMSSTVERQSELLRDGSGELNSMVQEMLSNILNFIVTNAKKLFMPRYILSENTNSKMLLNLRMIFSVGMSINGLLGSIMTLSILGLGGYKVIIGTLTLGGLVTFNIYSQRLVSPLIRITQFNMKVANAFVSWKKINDILATTAVEQNNTIDLPQDHGDITFKNVCFSYGEKTIFDNLNLKLEAGKTHAIVGESGVGKTTLIYLLLRIWQINEGEIKINGINIKDIDIEILREFIGVVTQNTYILNDSIFNNILLGHQIENFDFENVLYSSDLYGFVDGLPNKWDTKVGQNGVKLSGGQKQKISIARTILRKSPILVFDEATSNLDNKSEDSILSSLFRNMKGKTKIIISHRLTTIIEADIIHVIKDGKVIEEGTHRDLMICNGYYHSLYNVGRREDTISLQR